MSYPCSCGSESTPFTYCACCEKAERAAWERRSSRNEKALREVTAQQARAKAQRAAQRAAFADHIYGASEPITHEEMLDACINESKNEVEVEP